MKKSQRLAAVLLILLMLCGCSMPATPNTVVLPQTPAENHTESAPASAEPAQTTPETNAFHLEYEQTALPEPLSSVTALAMLEETLLLGGVSETGLALVRLTPEGRSEELPLPGSTEYLYALCPDGAGGAWLLCGSLPKGYFDAFGNFRFLSQEPEGKLALAHYDAAFALQEIVLLQTLYTDRFFQLRRLDGGFCMMSASLLVRLDETGAETARQSLDAKDGWSFAAMQETDGVLYALTRNFYGIELPELRKFTPDTLSALESDVCTSEITGLGLRADGRLLMGNSEELFAYDTGSGETETLVRWQEIGANVLTEQPWELEDGYLLFRRAIHLSSACAAFPDRRPSGPCSRWQSCATIHRSGRSRRCCRTSTSIKTHIGSTGHSTRIRSTRTANRSICCARSSSPDGARICSRFIQTATTPFRLRRRTSAQIFCRWWAARSPATRFCRDYST